MGPAFATPSLDAHVETVSVQLFGLLRKYARAGMGTGNNRELVLSAFKVGLFVCLLLFTYFKLCLFQVLLLLLLLLLLLFSNVYCLFVSGCDCVGEGL